VINVQQETKDKEYEEIRKKKNNYIPGAKGVCHFVDLEGKYKEQWKHLKLKIS